MSGSWPGVLTLSLTLGTIALPAGGAEQAPPRPLIRLKVRVQPGSQSDLKASQVKYALFPGGKRCAFTYFGPRSPRTIGVLSKLGFRTTRYVGPATSAETLQALEAAGADVGISIWGAKGTYASHIGANTIQQAFDAVLTSRLVLRKKCRGPLACGSIAGHYGIKRFPVDRDPDRGSGFGYAYHDANFLLLSDNKPYMIYLARQGDDLLAHRVNFDNRMRSHRVPSEIIYYQILANQFRGTLQRVEKGQIVRFSLRDLKAPDLAELTDVIGQYGRHKHIWHANEAELGANEYVRKKVRVVEVNRAGGELEIVLGVAEDVFPPFLLTPLPLELPAGLSVKGAEIGGLPCAVTAAEQATSIDVPLRAALRNGCEMTLRPARPDMTVPDEMALDLTIRNTSEKPITGARLRWVGDIGLTVSSADDAPFDLPAGSQRRIKAAARTTSEARFGIAPVRAIVTADAGGRAAVFMEGFELVLAPRLRVEVDPMQRIPLPKGRSQHFFVHIDNRSSSTPGGPADLFISHKAGPCKGTVGFDLPAGMKATPTEQAFELGPSQRKTLIFKLHNDRWHPETVMARPVIRFEGEDESRRDERVYVLFPGTRVVRDRKMLDFKPLDDQGLLVYASWDDQTKSANYDRACGSVRCGQSGSPCVYSNEGVKGWCLSARTGALADSFKNIDYQVGTICLWMRKDPLVRNENTYVPNPAETRKVTASQWNNRGESIFGMNSFAQIAAASHSGITLRRYRSWKGKQGYLQATYQGMGRQIHCVQVPYEWTEQWRHVAVLWDIDARRLEIYLDGKLAGKADPGEEEWYGAPWDRGRPSGEMFSPISCDHGKWTGTQRDEFYVYNRPLTPAEIAGNMALAKRKD